MATPSRKSLTTTVDELLNTFAFAPDCTIANNLYGNATPLTAQVGKGYRLVSVNDKLITDSGDLKDVLLQAAGSSNTIKVVFEHADESKPRVAIENSVISDGAVSSVTAPNAEKVKAMVTGLTPPSAALAVPPSTGAAAAAAAALPSFKSPASADGLSERTSKTASTTQSLHRKSSAASVKSTSSRSGQSSGPKGMPPRSASSSESSLPDFNSVRLGPPSKSATPGQHGPNDSSPDLLEFEKMKLSSLRGEGVTDAVMRAMADVNELSVKHRLSRALAKAQPGRCVLCVTQEVNPIAELELLALASQRRLVAFDLSVKLRLRPKPAVLSAQFAEAMRSGAWFALVNAHKSINTCDTFAELLTEARARNLEGFDPNSRIIISLEPHPHFPKSLIEDAVVIKISSNFENSVIFNDSMATSMSRARLVTADALTASMTNPPAAGTGIGANTTAVARRPPQRHVRINAAVDIVEIAPREVVKPVAKDTPIDVSGSVALLKSFSGVPTDKFLCVRDAGEPGRFAVGSSLGNVYFLDSLGNSLLQAHAHNASIWDVCFSDKYNFATGCEDGTSASWKLSSTLLDPSTDDSVLLPTSATSLGADVYCVSYLKNIHPSPLIIGGLHNNLVIRPVPPADGSTAAGSNEVFLVPIPLNAQVVDCLPNNSVALVGGGDGSVSVIDVERVVSLGTMTEHTRKLPALTVRDDNQFFTGSFDSHILSWDLRVPAGVVGGAKTDDMSNASVSASTSHTLKLKNYVTGLNVDDIHLAASVGENLYLWDVRKLGTVLGGYPQGWKGLSRGVKVESESHLVVTASPDGHVRFWNFV